MRKFVALTGIRSDYDLMTPLFNRLNESSDFELGLIVGGAHLSKSFGYSVNEIRNDGYNIVLLVESLINGDSLQARLKSLSVLLGSIADYVGTTRPDAILCAGDREEALVASLVGHYLRLPVFHFYGGDHTSSGHIDDSVRHATSKLASFHFVQTIEHKRRLIAIGEDPSTIFVVGNLSVYRFINQRNKNFSILQENLLFKKLNKPYAVLIFHPHDLEDNQVEIMAAMIDESILAGFDVCLSYPNSDPGYERVVRVIDQYENNPKVYIYKNLSNDQFVALLANAKFIIGNSSSGILEAGVLPLAAINVGIRQAGRLAGRNVVFCAANAVAIRSAIQLVIQVSFLEGFTLEDHPYFSKGEISSVLEILMRKELYISEGKKIDPLDCVKLLSDY